MTIPRQYALKPSKHAAQVIGPLWVNFVLTDRIRNKTNKNFLELTIINLFFTSFGLILIRLLPTHTHNYKSLRNLTFDFDINKWVVNDECCSYLGKELR